MFCYVAGKMGDGTRGNPYRPDLPIGISFVGIPSDYRDIYLIATNKGLEGYEQKALPMQQGEIEEITDGLTYRDILTWYVGDG